jgi:hypothetical protein
MSTAVRSWFSCFTQVSQVSAQLAEKIPLLMFFLSQAAQVIMISAIPLIPAV